VRGNAITRTLTTEPRDMGLRTSQLTGTVFDGIARHMPEGIAWRDLAVKEGFKEAVRQRDTPHGDYRYGRSG
jgi:enoyl-CoA hydratase